MSSPRRFVVPDIHGCAKTFQRLVTDMIQLQKSDHLHLLGDYIDRGPRSKEVIDFIFTLRRDGFNVHPLRGNHEDMLIRACSDPEATFLWLANGGEATLNSFGVNRAAEIPMHYRTFFISLPFFSSLKDVVLVHAGMNFHIADPFSDSQAMLWERSNDINPDAIGGRTLICGHTPQSRAAIRHSASTKKIMLDNGCVFAGNGGLGALTALEITEWKLYFQDNIDF